MIGPWIAENQVKKATAQAEIRNATGHRQLSRDDIAAIVAPSPLAQVVREADPADKANLYAQLKLTLTYQPDQRLVEATVKPGLNMLKGSVSEGLHQMPMAALRPVRFAIFRPRVAPSNWRLLPGRSS